MNRVCCLGIFLFVSVLRAEETAVRLASENTYAVIVGVLDWEEDSLQDYPTKDRQDRALYDQLLAMGIAEDHMILLLDEAATRKAVNAAVTKLAREAGKDSTLILYYAGHGMLADGGEGVFACYDIRIDDSLETGWRHQSITESLAGFEGDKVLLFADCCFSGSLGVVAEQLNDLGFQAASLTSASSKSVSTNNWTFTMSLISSLKGEACVDFNRDGVVALEEAAQDVRASMQHYETQRSGFSCFGLEGLELTAVERPLTKTEEPHTESSYTMGQFVLVENLSVPTPARIVSMRATEEGERELELEFQYYAERRREWYYEGNVIASYWLPRDERALTEQEALEKASLNGKLTNLLHVLECPLDERVYGKFYNFGLWNSTAYRQYQNLTVGVWVYVYPNWYVWEEPEQRGREEVPVEESRVVEEEIVPQVVPQIVDAAADLQLFKLLEIDIPLLVQEEEDVVGVADKRAWDAWQMTGKPNTPMAGDAPSAWASKNQDSEKVWVELHYEEAVVPAQVHVYETYNPGAVYRVTAFVDDEEVQLWKGKDPTPMTEASGISKIPLTTDEKVKRIRLYLNSPAVPGWNEIDAVGILDSNKSMHWAVGAQASSNYSQQQPEIEFEDPFITREELLAEKMALLSADIAKRKQIVRALRQQIEQENAEIRRLYEELDSF